MSTLCTLFYIYLVMSDLKIVNIKDKQETPDIQEMIDTLDSMVTNHNFRGVERVITYKRVMSYAFARLLEETGFDEASCVKAVDEMISQYVETPNSIVFTPDFDFEFDG